MKVKPSKVDFSHNTPYTLRGRLRGRLRRFRDPGEKVTEGHLLVFFEIDVFN